MQGLRVPSLVKTLRFHMPNGQKINKMGVVLYLAHRVFIRIIWVSLYKMHGMIPGTWAALDSVTCRHRRVVVCRPVEAQWASARTPAVVAALSSLVRGFLRSVWGRVSAQSYHPGWGTEGRFWQSRRTNRRLPREGVEQWEVGAQIQTVGCATGPSI